MMSNSKIDKMILLAIEQLFTPYIWGGNHPRNGLDCSGFIVYLLRGLGDVPPTFDTTAHGLYEKYRENEIDQPLRGALLFYGQPNKIKHVMLCLSDVACVGAVRGNKHIDTPERAMQRGACVNTRKINYRKDLIHICDIFKEDV